MIGGELLRMQYQLEVPGSHYINYLPFFYLIPEDMMARFPTLSTLPRCFGDIPSSDEHLDTVESMMFANEISDAIATLVFSHFGVRGWLEHYSADSPVWKLAYCLPYWLKALKDEVGWSLQTLFNAPRRMVMPFLSHEQVNNVMGCVVKRAIRDNNLQSVFDIVKKMPCEEDFEKWDTQVRIDFLRHWYHYRSTNVQSVSLEACLEDEEHAIHDIEDTTENIEDTAVAEDYYQRFKERLSEKDMQILQMRVDGFTYEEIAKTLGYKNHSGVIKRMQSITKAFIKYEEEG